MGQINRCVASSNLKSYGPKELQSNVTDHDSAKMKRSHGIIQGDNANAMVDAKHQVIVHAQAFGEGDDGALAAPMLKGAQANLRAAGCDTEVLAATVVSADTCGKRKLIAIGNL